MKRFLALALSLVMILGVLLVAGCNNDDTTSTTTKAPTQSSTTGSTSESTTESTGDDGDVFDPTKKMPGYEDVDFGGRTFVLIGADGESDGYNTAKEIYIEEDNENPDAIDLAVDQRNRLIETLYNCTIQGEVVESPATDALNNVLKGGNQIDIFNQKYAAASHATSGKVYNLFDLGSRTIDFTADYFDQTYVNTYTIKDANGNSKLYNIVGDFARSSFDCTHTLVFNKTVYANTEAIRDIDIYQLVRDGKWTLDTFMSMVKAAAVDNEVAGSYDYAVGDIVGWIRTAHATHGLHTASGLTIMSNNNGVLSFNIASNLSAWTTVMDKACQAWAMPEGQTTSYSVIPAAVAGGYALFSSELLGSSLYNLKDYDVEIGVLPYPTFNEGDNYYHYVDTHMSPYAVPLHVEDIQNVGDFLVLFAYYSKYTVREAYINVYAYEYCSDEDSYEMLNLCLDTRTYDIGYMGASLEGEISNLINNNKPQVISNFANSKATVAQNWINDFVTKITANQS